MKTKTSKLLFFCFLTMILNSCEKDKEKEELKWTSYPIESIPYDHFAKDLAIDSEGYVWIGATDGLYKFDGSDWTFNNGRNSISSLYIDEENTKWLGCVNYWAGSSCGIHIFAADNTWSTITNAISVYAIDKDADGSIWVATHHGIAKWDGILTEYSKDIDNTAISTNAIAVDNEGEKWIGSYPALLKFDNVSWTVYQDITKVNAVYLDDQDTKWIGTFDGVVKIENSEQLTYSVDDGLVNNCVYSILKDNKGHLWFATLDGISEFDGTNWVTHHKGNAFNSMVIDLDGTLWALSYKTLYKYSK